MADITNLSEFLTDIADAIRTKKETSEPIAAENFDTEILNLETGGVGDVKLFATEEEMQADENPKEGDLAVVYRNEIQNMTESSVFTGLSFKNTIVLDTAITGSEYAYLVDEKQSYETQCQIRISSTYFYIRDYYTYEYIVRYESSDGITYTKTSGEDTHVFEQPMHFYGTWNDVYGKFIQCGGMMFEGFYEYTTGLVDNTKFYFGDISTLDLTYTTDTSATVNDIQPHSTVFDSNLIKELSQKIHTDFGVNTYAPRFYLNKAGELCFIIKASSGGVFAAHLVYDSSCKLLGVGSSDESYNASSSSKVTTYKVDMANKTYTKIKDYTSGTKFSSLYASGYYYIPLTDISSTIVYCNASSYAFNNPTNQTIYVCDSAKYKSYSTSLTSAINSNDFYVHYDAYIHASTQFTLNNANQLLPGKTAYGPKGVITGDGSIYNNLDWPTIFSNFNLSKSNMLSLKEVEISNAIITYTPNSTALSYIYASLAASSTPYVNKVDVVGNSNTFINAKIDDDTVLTFKGTYVSDTESTMYVYQFKRGTDGVITTSKVATCSINVSEYSPKFVKYNPADNCVYVVCSSSSGLGLNKYNVATQVYTNLFQVTGNYQYCKFNIDFTNNLLYLDSSSQSGFYRFSFSGTKTKVHGHTGYSSAYNSSDTYIIAYNGSKGALYNMKTKAFTSITLGQQSEGSLYTIDDTTYLVESTTVKIIKNDAVTETITIDFTNLPGQTEFDSAMSSTKGGYTYLDRPIIHNNEIIAKNLYIDMTNKKAVALPLEDILMLLYKNNLDYCGIYTSGTTIYQCNHVDAYTTGEGIYPAFLTASNKYTLMTAQDAYLRTHFSLDTETTGPISQEEYDVAIDTANEILGEEE